MRTSSWWTGILLSALLTASACGSGGSKGAGNHTVTGASIPGGGTATFHAGALPAAHGAITVSVPAAAMGVNGGSTEFDITASTTIVTVYIAIDGEDGYWQIPVPAGSTLAQVLLTFAQAIAMNSALSITFEVADAAGNVSAPQSTPTNIIHTGSGDVVVALSWDVDNDLDLHVVDPNSIEVYYGNDGVSFPGGTDGGMLDLDSNAACSINHVRNEHIVWPTGMAPHGTYTVRVDNFSNCASAAANYVVTVEVIGKAAQTFVGSFAADAAGDDGSSGSGVTVTTFTY